MLKVVQENSDVPVYTTAEGEKLVAEADIVLTTHELQNKEARQIFLPMLPQVAVAGEVKMMGNLSEPVQQAEGRRALCLKSKAGAISASVWIPVR